MKILQINSVYKVGSTGHIVSDISKAIEHSGHDSFIAYAVGKESSDRIYTMENLLYQKINILKTRAFGKHGFYNTLATKKLIHWIKQINPDIIHLHNLHGHYINIKLLFDYLSESNKPIVWTLHDCWSLTGHCAHFEKIGCDKWRNGCHHCIQKREYPISWIFDRSKSAWYDKKNCFSNRTPKINMTIVPVSKWLGEKVRLSFLSEYPQKIIYNGVNTSIFFPRIVPSSESNHACDKFTILTMANKWFIRSNVEVRNAISTIVSNDIEVIVLGCSVKQIAIKEKGIRKVGFVSDPEELAYFYSRSNVFLNLTWEDTFPTVNLEALACGTPVITLKSGGSPEALNPSTGFIINKGDINGIIRALLLIKDNCKSYYYYNCVNRATTMFNSENNYFQYIKIYNDIMSHVIPKENS